MAYLVVDLEAVLDPAMPAWEPRNGRDGLAPPPFWQMVVIGMLWADADFLTKRIGVAAGADERAMLGELIRIVEERSPDLVTFNGRRFDLPVITARCLRHGLAFPARFRRDVLFRYTEDGHADLADLLVDFGAGQHASLDAWAKLVGMPGKLDGDGSKVAEMIAAGRLAEVQAYCLEDVAQTAAVWLRFLLARGLERERYVAAVRSLLAAVDGDARLAALAAKIDRPRLLLEGSWVTGKEEA